MKRRELTYPAINFKMFRDNNVNKPNGELKLISQNLNVL